MKPRGACWCLLLDLPQDMRIRVRTVREFSSDDIARMLRDPPALLSRAELDLASFGFAVSFTSMVRVVQ